MLPGGSHKLEHQGSSEREARRADYGNPTTYRQKSSGRGRPFVIRRKNHMVRLRCYSGRWWDENRLHYGSFVSLALALAKLNETENWPHSPITDYVAAVSVGIYEGRPYGSLLR